MAWGYIHLSLFVRQRIDYEIAEVYYCIAERKCLQCMVSASGSAGVESEVAVGWWQRDHRAVEQVVRVKHAEPLKAVFRGDVNLFMKHSNSFVFI
jgi:hypothetical protein